MTANNAQLNIAVGDVVGQWNETGVRGVVIEILYGMNTDTVNFPQARVKWDGNGGDTSPWWVGNLFPFDKAPVKGNMDGVVLLPFDKAPTWPGEPDSEGRANGLTPFGESVVSNLRAAADTFEERAAVYRDNYKRVGAVMVGLFPDGPPELRTEDDYNRWHLFELAVVKLTRYAVNYGEGHKDSLQDLIVYLSMVLALDEQR